ncbi:MAG TPA: DUF4974 domain-containing protein, partial [Yeosuana sp.]
MNFSAIKAQSLQKEKQPLIDILKVLETKYNISFSFADTTIKDKTVALPAANLNIEEALTYLKTETGLDFEILDSRFVVIKIVEDIIVPMITQRLEEVVITNYLTKGIIKLNDGSTTIKPEAFGILPGLIEPDILQTIQALPGVLSI